MEVIDYNGEGRWTAEAILARYARLADAAGIVARDLSPREHLEEKHGRRRRWIYPVMDRVVEGIAADDSACVQIGIEFIEEDARFPFGRTLKCQVARALRKYATLSEGQKSRIRRRAFAMLAAGNIPWEFADYAKLVRKIGYEAKEIPAIDESRSHVRRFRDYFLNER